MTEQQYTLEFRVDDIPEYGSLFIRDGEQVVNKHIGEIMHNWNSVIKYYKGLKRQVPKGVENREAILAGYTTYIKHLKEQRDKEMGR